MRKFSTAIEPLASSVTPRSIRQPSSSAYVCRACLRMKTAQRLAPSSSSSFSTSSKQAAVLDSLKDVGKALQGEKSMFDKKADEKKETSYEPADNWNGLRWIGTKQWYEDTRRPQQAFEGYGPITSPITDRTRIREELMKAVNEVLNPQLQPSPLSSTELENEIDAVSMTSEVNLAQTPTSQSAPGLHSAKADQESIKGKKWFSVPLDSLDDRCKIAKLVQERTGIRLSDPQITHSRTVGAMFVNLWRPKKPTKLAEGLLKTSGLADLPNVSIADHRVTFVHREQQVGRWKVIEEELGDREIPPLGRPDLTNLPA